MQGERERIARELHDGLAQVLGYVNTKSQAATELLAAGRVDEARVQIDELAAAARSIYVDVREAILGLSSPVEPSGGLVAAIRDYADRFAEASKLASGSRPSPMARIRPGPGGRGRPLPERARGADERPQARRRPAGDDPGRARGRHGRRSRSRTTGAASTRTLVAGADADWPHHGLTGMRERAAGGRGGSVDWRPAGTARDRSSG